jgi:hypothetical protein
VSQYLAYRYGRGLHPPDALIEPVLGRRNSLHDLDGDGPTGCGPPFFVRGAPAPLRAPSGRPPRRPDWDRAPAPKAHAGGFRSAHRGHPADRRTRPVVPQPGRTFVDAYVTHPLSYGRNRSQLVQEVCGPYQGGPRARRLPARLP